MARFTTYKKRWLAVRLFSTVKSQNLPSTIATTKKIDSPTASKNLNSVSVEALALSCFAAAAKTVTSHYKDGPKVKEWDIAYSASVAMTKALLKRLVSMGPNSFIHGIQSVTSYDAPIPMESKIISDSTSFISDAKVIQFFKQTNPTNFPDVAAVKSTTSAEWITVPESQLDRIVYFLHGGNYYSGSIQMYRRMAYHLAKQSRASVYGINYRLAPQNPYPCALIDAVSGYKKLLEKYDPQRIIIAGDSSGGGLAIGTMMAIRDMGLPAPAGGYAISPWVDMSSSFTDHSHYHDTDLMPMVPFDNRLDDQKHYYIPDEFSKTVYASPFWQKNFKNLPPLLIQCSDIEKLYKEIDEFASKAAIDWTSITLEVYQNHVHDFPLLEFSEGSKAAMKRAGDWIQHRTGSLTRIDLNFKGVEVFEEHNKQ
ncbi:Alpha/Beta hydrolase protein [Globomyces pollinis-pini]|nr:Alpha/Beta hydrolase protein [Globomyces pollinis-pini]